MVSVYDMIYERFSDVYSTELDSRLVDWKRRAIEQADAVICISETTAHDLREFYGLTGSRIHVVPLAHSDIFRVRSVEERYPFLLYVGRRDCHIERGVVAVLADGCSDCCW